ncbi:MAG: hypothetical protein DWQ44_00070 [Bacteroidetes bacterium]|nr:MAG: hypothetical protein DWQ33_05020 [Bacteroidota bacterium]REK06025.1 MAG: hypothetical protein DWQ39_04160 [Bacteroidota bacterium]REK37083.1 MAG: hypothetical protein DWQ44_00070 [Bacteroidota bacterium]REK47524.1 MAG: hypothetical protein DWQ48_12375 [Bacteroidota bacterium]
MESTTHTSEIAKAVEDFKVVIDSAPAALQLNEELLEKAIIKGAELRLRIEGGEMDDDLDEQVNDHMVKLKSAKDKSNARRAPVTRFFDEIKKRFTGIERSFDEEISFFQISRDNYAAEKLRQQKEREEKARRELAIKQEAIDYRSRVDQELRSIVAAKTKEQADHVHHQFNRVTLENYERAFEYFQKVVPDIEKVGYDAITIHSGSHLLSHDQMQGIVDQAKSELKHDLLQQFSSELSKVIQSCRDNMPGKKRELIEIRDKQAEADRLAKEAKSNAEKAAAEQARLAAERAKKEAEERERQAAAERERIAKEQAEKAALEAEAKRDAQMAETLFDHQAAQAELLPSQPKGREGYKITVNAAPGFALIFKMWYDNEGKSLKVDQILKKKIESLVTFCEKHAHKTGEKIESPLITYEEVFKTRVER